MFCFVPQPATSLTNDTRLRNYHRRERWRYFFRLLAGSLYTPHGQFPSPQYPRQVLFYHHGVGSSCLSFVFLVSVAGDLGFILCFLRETWHRSKRDFVLFLFDFCYGFAGSDWNYIKTALAGFLGEASEPALQYRVQIFVKGRGAAIIY